MVRVMTAIVLIGETGEKVQWIYQHAWPHIQPLFQQGYFCPETFWWDNLALPYQRGEPPADIHSKLEAELERLCTEGEPGRLVGSSESERKQIASAYAKVLFEIRRDYPNQAPKLA
jgi:hypothetical protein